MKILFKKEIFRNYLNLISYKNLLKIENRHHLRIKKQFLDLKTDFFQQIISLLFILF
jgi:hypothetical protein